MAPKTYVVHRKKKSADGLKYSLYSKIDRVNLECLNEHIQGSGKNAFKTWENRMDFTLFVESDYDEDLLFNIPFTESVKLKSIMFIGDGTNTQPSKLKLFKNRPRMTFDDVDLVPDQELDLQKDNTDLIEYQTKPPKFVNITHLSLYFPTNFGADFTRIYYIGLRGEMLTCTKSKGSVGVVNTKPNCLNERNSNRIPSRVAERVKCCNFDYFDECQ